MFTPGPSPSPIGSGIERLLNSLALVRPGERRTTAGAFLLLVAFMAGHAMLETARDALFLARLPVRQLPWVYLAIALGALVLMSWSGGRRQRRHSLVGWLVAGALGTFLLYLGTRTGRPWVFYLLYVWSGLLATAVVVRFWTLLGGSFSLLQAKRLFPVVASGSVLGAIAGSAAARAISEVLPANALVLAAGITFLMAAPAAMLIGAQPAASAISGTAEVRRTMNQVWRQPYLRRLALLILIGSMTFTLIDFAFKAAVARFVLVEDMGEFLASVYLTLNVLSLVLQVFAVAGLVRLAGVHAAVVMVPLLIAGAAVGAALWLGITSLLLLKMVDGSLRHSVHRTGTELLFVPLPFTVRGPAKAIIDVLGQRGGQALGSLLILLVLALFNSERAAVIAATAAAACWTLLAVTIRPSYLDQFRRTIASAPVGPADNSLAGPSLESALAALNSEDDHMVLAALDLLAEGGKLQLVPALVLYHPSNAVALRALEAFHQAGLVASALPIVNRLTEHADPAIRATALRLSAAAGGPVDRLEQALSDSDAGVRATAQVALAALTGAPLPTLTRSQTADASVAIAESLKVLPTPAAATLLREMLVAESEAVKISAVEAAAVIGDEGLTGDLVPLLADRAVRYQVRQALVNLGQPALTQLLQALADRSLPHEVRRQIPFAVADFETSPAAEGLLGHLLVEPDGLIRYKILLALSQWRDALPAGKLDNEAIRQARRQTVAGALRFGVWRAALSGREQTASPWRRSLVALLRDKQVHSLERLLLLLHLETGNDDFRYIAAGFAAGNVESIGGSRELLEHLVPAGERRDLLRLADEVHDPTYSGQLGDEDDVEAALSEMLTSRVESLSALAAREMAHLGLEGFIPLLLRTETISPGHGQAIRNALEELRRNSRGFDGAS